MPYSRDLQTVTAPVQQRPLLPMQHTFFSQKRLVYRYHLRLYYASFCEKAFFPTPLLSGVCMIRRLTVDELKRGMYVLDTRKGCPLAVPLYSVEGFILSDEEVALIRAKGFTHADVDESRFSDTPEERRLDQRIFFVPIDDPEDAGINTFSNNVDFGQECERARAVYSQCLDLAKNFQKSVSTQQTVDINRASPMFDQLVESLNSNQSALLSICKLRTRDAYTYSHCVNVALYATLLGRKLYVRLRDLGELAMAAFFHDIGKLFMPLELLNYPGKLSSEQFSIMRKHSTLGLAYMEEQLHLPHSASLAALDHHERPDGSGYPHGKKLATISFVGQVVAVADVYDALSSRRPYKSPMHPAEALSVMYKIRESNFAPGLLEAFIEVMGVYPTGCLVQLSNRYAAVVTEQTRGQPARPRVVLLANAYGQPLANPRLVDLMVHTTLSISRPLLSLPESIDVEESIRFAY